MATTFINKNVGEFILRDLKGLLKEAGQRIPPILEMLEDPADRLAQEVRLLLHLYPLVVILFIRSFGWGFQALDLDLSRKKLQKFLLFSNSPQRSQHRFSIFLCFVII